jgi:dUTP pyrophosphatase
MELQLVNYTGVNWYNKNKNLKGDAGYDLHVPETHEILPGESKMIDLEVSCQMRSITFNPVEWFKNKSVYKYHGYFLVPRSSISKTPLVLKNSIGIIDATYTGHLKVCVLNTSDELYTIKKGERLFQIIHPSMKPFNTKLVDELRETTRGSGGFGSTGK